MIPLAPLLGFFSFATPFLVKQVLLLLGMSVAIYTGIDLVFDQVESSVISQLGQLPAVVSDIIGLSGFGIAIQMNLSAMAASIALKQVMGSFKKMSFGG